MFCFFIRSTGGPICQGEGRRYYWIDVILCRWICTPELRAMLRLAYCENCVVSVNAHWEICLINGWCVGHSIDRGQLYVWRRWVKRGRETVGGNSWDGEAKRFCGNIMYAWLFWLFWPDSRKISYCGLISCWCPVRGFPPFWFQYYHPLLLSVHIPSA